MPLCVVTTDKVITDTPLPVVTACTATASEQINVSGTIHTLLPVQAMTQNYQVDTTTHGNQLLSNTGHKPPKYSVLQSHTTTRGITSLQMFFLHHYPWQGHQLLHHWTTSVNTPSHTLKWSRVQNKLVEVGPNTLPLTLITEISTDNSSIAQKPATDSAKHSTLIKEIL